MERDSVHALGGRTGSVRVWQSLLPLSRRCSERLGGAAVRGGHLSPAHSVPRRAPGGAGGARTHARQRMAARDRARPARNGRAAARRTRARPGAAHRTGAARVPGRTTSGVRARRRERHERATRARRRDRASARCSPGECRCGLRLAGGHPRDHPARFHEPLADPKRPLPLGPGRSVAARDARRPPGRSRSRRRSARGDRARAGIGPADRAGSRPPARRRMAGCRAVARWTSRGREPDRGWTLGAGPLAGRLARRGRRAARDRWQHRGRGVDGRRGPLVRRRPDRRPAGIPLARLGRPAVAHERATGRPRAGAARRRYALVHGAHGARLGAAPRAGARGRCAGFVRRAAAVRPGAGGGDLRDRLHDVAVAAATVLDSGVRQRGTNRTVRGRAHGRDGRLGSLLVRRGRVRLSGAAPRRRRLRAGIVAAR